MILKLLSKINLNKKQSIIATVVEVIAIFAVPYLNRHGFNIVEADFKDALIALFGVLAYFFANWYNHNYTPDAEARQMEKMEDLMYSEEELEEDYEEEDMDEEEGDM